MLTSIPASLAAAVADWQDTTLLPKGQGGMGEPCVVYYPPIPSAVSMPELIPAGGKTQDLMSAGTDFPFQYGQVDPMEFGQNFIDIEQSETIYMTINWEPATFSSKFPPGFKYQDGTIMTKGKVADMGKVMNAEYIEIFQSAGFNHFKFKLIGEPTIPGQFTGSRYFYALWQRA